jgi:FkbM family methyltransferase
MKQSIDKWRIAKTQSLKALATIMPPPQTILDVGVLTGTYELVQAFPRAHHVLFEPVKEHHASITANYTKWKVKYSLIPCAVSSQCGHVNLKTWSVYPGQGISHARMSTDSTPSSDSTAAVQMITLDSFAGSQALPGPFLLKVDIDGLEHKVLEGAKQTLEQCSAVVVEARPANFDAIVTMMARIKFKLFDIVDFCYYNNKLAQFDLCFIHPTVWEASPIYKDGFDINKWAYYPRDIAP